MMGGGKVTPITTVNVRHRTQSFPAAALAKPLVIAYPPDSWTKIGMWRRANYLGGNAPRILHLKASTPHASITKISRFAINQFITQIH
jgi:hypothetical protein